MAIDYTKLEQMDDDTLLKGLIAILSTALSATRRARGNEDVIRAMSLTMTYALVERFNVVSESDWNRLKVDFLAEMGGLPDFNVPDDLSGLDDL